MTEGRRIRMRVHGQDPHRQLLCSGGRYAPPRRDARSVSPALDNPASVPAPTCLHPTTDGRAGGCGRRAAAAAQPASSYYPGITGRASPQPIVTTTSAHSGYDSCWLLGEWAGGGPGEPSPQPERDVDEPDEDGHLDQRANDPSERLPGRCAEDAHSHGDRELEVVRGDREGEGRSLWVREAHAPGPVPNPRSHMTAK